MGNSFRLLTANLLHHHCDAAAFGVLLDRLNPDAVVAVELGKDAAREIEARFPHHLLLPAEDATGRGVAASKPAAFEEIPMSGWDGVGAVIDLSGTPLRLAGVHLVNPNGFPWWRTARVRGEQIRAIFEWLGSDGPAVAAGDFNASPAWPAYGRMAEQLDDLVVEWADGEGVRPEKTWGWRPGWPRMLRIDHVFGRDVVARGAQVVPVVGSDHWAVAVDLILSEHGLA